MLSVLIVCPGVLWAIVPASRPKEDCTLCCFSFLSSGAKPDGWRVELITTIAFPAPQLEPSWLMFLFVFHSSAENHSNFMPVPVCVRDLRKIE